MIVSIFFYQIPEIIFKNTSENVKCRSPCVNLYDIVLSTWRETSSREGEPTKTFVFVGVCVCVKIAYYVYNNMAETTMNSGTNICENSQWRMKSNELWNSIDPELNARIQEKMMSEEIRTARGIISALILFQRLNNCNLQKCMAWELIQMLS